MYICVYIYIYISVFIYALNILKHKKKKSVPFDRMKCPKSLERKPWKFGSRSPLLEMVSESETEQSSHLLVLYQGVDHLQDGALWLLSKKKKQVQLSYCRWKKSG